MPFALGQTDKTIDQGDRLSRWKIDHKMKHQPTA